jgi:hypothetical protein
MTHLTREELERWWREGLSADRGRVVGHLAECDECGALYGGVADAEVAAAGRALPARRDLVARGYRAYRSRRRPSGFLRSRPWIAAWATAAVVLIAVAIPILRRSRPAVIPDEGGIRGTSLQPLAPIGTVEPPVEFRWRSPVRAARYVIEVRDEGRRRLFSLSSEAETVTLSAERLAALAPGETYWWEVVALGPDGEEIMRAPPRAFAVSGGSR